MLKNISTGMISTIMGAAILFMTSQLPESNMAGDIGPRLFPYIAGTILVFCGVLQVIVSVREAKTENGSIREKPFLTKEGYMRLFLLVAVLVIYTVLLSKIGFLIPSMVVLFILITLFSGEEQIAIWKRVLISVAVPLIIYIAFVKGLSLRMPTGIVEKSLNRLL